MPNAYISNSNYLYISFFFVNISIDNEKWFVNKFKFKSNINTENHKTKKCSLKNQYNHKIINLNSVGKG